MPKLKISIKRKTLFKDVSGILEVEAKTIEDLIKAVDGVKFTVS